MCRPGTIGMITDHGALADERVMRARDGFQPLKSPMTATWLARLFSNTNCCKIGRDSAAFAPALLNCPDALGMFTAVAPGRGGVVIHAPRATKPMIIAAAIPSTLQTRIDPLGGWLMNTGSSAGE